MTKFNDQIHVLIMRVIPAYCREKRFSALHSTTLDDSSDDSFSLALAKATIRRSYPVDWPVDRHSRQSLQVSLSSSKPSLIFFALSLPTLRCTDLSPGNLVCSILMPYTCCTMYQAYSTAVSTGHFAEYVSLVLFRSATCTSLGLFLSVEL